MSVAKDRALSTRSLMRFDGNVSDDQLESLLRRYRLRKRNWLFRGKINEMLWGNEIWLRATLSTHSQRWLTAHAVGHFLLHRGNHIEATDSTLIAKQERQAELFAGWLFLADTWDKMPPWRLTELHCLPQDRIERWLGLVSGEIAISASW